MEDLQNFLESKPIKAKPVSIMSRLGKRVRRNPVVAILSIVLIALSVLASLLWIQNIRRSEKVIEEPAIMTLSKEDLKRYYAVYKDPYVMHLRKALNGYLDGSNEGMDIPELTIQKHKLDDTQAGLSSFDRSYYESKFVVFEIVDSIAGGKNITIIFQDKPDKIFTAWVYKMYGGKYDLRDFWEMPIGQEELAKTRKMYKRFLQDKEHAL